MKTKVFVSLGLLACNLLVAQEVKVDVVPEVFEVRSDSVELAMDLTVNVSGLKSKEAVRLTPVLAVQNREKRFPSILLNGKQKQKLYLRNQILRRKSRENDPDVYLVADADTQNGKPFSYRSVVVAEPWMEDASLLLKRTLVKADGEAALKDTLLVRPERNEPVVAESVSVPLPDASGEPVVEKASPGRIAYKGAYVSPEADEVDARNQKELNFSLEEAKAIADINPQMLSLRELYTVALSYKEDLKNFYRIIDVSVRLYPVHPVANLNAAAAAIERGNVKAAGKYLAMALHEHIAYKNCRGVYELMSGNTYEGIRLLKAAKAEGSEEASYNLNEFFAKSKQP